jgi:hypothetical protein
MTFSHCPLAVCQKCVTPIKTASKITGLLTYFSRIIVEIPRLRTIRHVHPVAPLRTSDQLVAEAATDTTHKTTRDDHLFVCSLALRLYFIRACLFVMIVLIFCLFVFTYNIQYTHSYPRRDFFLFVFCCTVFVLRPYLVLCLDNVLHFAFLSLLYSTQNTNIHSLGGIRTRNPSKRSAADLRLRPHGRQDERVLMSG